MCARGSSRLCLLSSSTRTPWRSCVGIRTMGPVCWMWQVGMELGTRWTRLGSRRATFPTKLLDFPSLAVAPTNWFLEVTSSQRWDSGDCHYSSSIPVSGSRTRVPFPCRSRDSRGARWQREEIKWVGWSHLTQLIPGLLSLGWQRQTPRCPNFVFEVREEMTAGTTVPPWEARAAAGGRNQKERLGFSAAPLLTGSPGGGNLLHLCFSTTK